MRYRPGRYQNKSAQYTVLAPSMVRFMIHQGTVFVGPWLHIPRSTPLPCINQTTAIILTSAFIRLQQHHTTITLSTSTSTVQCCGESIYHSRTVTVRSPRFPLFSKTRLTPPRNQQRCPGLAAYGTCKSLLSMPYRFLENWWYKDYHSHPFLSALLLNP